MLQRGGARQAGGRGGKGEPVGKSEVLGALISRWTVRASVVGMESLNLSWEEGVGCEAAKVKCKVEYTVPGTKRRIMVCYHRMEEAAGNFLSFFFFLLLLTIFI
jgi:hypothetical protein